MLLCCGRRTICVMACSFLQDTVKERRLPDPCLLCNAWFAKYSRTWERPVLVKEVGLAMTTLPKMQQKSRGHVD